MLPVHTSVIKQTLTAHYMFPETGWVSETHQKTLLVLLNFQHIGFT